MDRILLIALCASLALAGCTENGADDDAPTTTTPATTPATSTPAATTPVGTTPATTPPVATTPPPAGNDTEEYVPYSIEVLRFPQAVEAGKNFSFVLRATGGVPATSDHVGAHYGNLSAPSVPANTTTYARGCPHFAGELPGTYNVTCSVPTEGTWYFRGHVRVGATNNSWGSEMPLTVRPAWNGTGNYTLNLTGVPTLARVGQNVTMNLTISGPTGVSNHFGAHYGANSTNVPSTAAYNNACSHEGIPTTVPTTYTVTCSFATPGVHYLRGHLRIDEGLPPAPSNFWTGEYAILVQ